MVYNALGRQEATMDKLGRVTRFEFDALGRLWRTVYPDQTGVSSGFDAEGRLSFSTNQLGRVTEYRLDPLGRQTNVIYPDLSQSFTFYDSLGRVQFSVDARGTTNAFGYDRAGRRVAETNAWGTGQETWRLYGRDANGNQVCVTNAAGVLATNYFDALNRLTNVCFADGNTTFTRFDAAGRRVAETNQDNVVTWFGYDGVGRLIAVTNALGTTNELVTRYEYDEAGNQTAQIDGLNRTNRFGYDLLNRRVWHLMPDGIIAETFGYDANGNLLRHTNFNGVVLTNVYDVANRLATRSSTNGYRVGFTYTPTGQRQTMTDPSGTTTCEYDERDRLRLKSLSWNAGPTVSLRYTYDWNGNLTDLWSSTTNGVNLRYAYDPLNRITNVLASGGTVAGYAFDAVGNLKSVRYANGVANLCEYDGLNRLTNMVWWKSNQTTLAGFYYQLGKAGHRTNLTETLLTAVTNRTYAWEYDRLYRLRKETISELGSAAYGLDKVGNRTSRTAGLYGLAEQNLSFTTNDWLTTDAYDSNGNTLWATNGATATGPYYYDAENRLTNFNNSVYCTYNGDGLRVRKTAGGTITYYLVDDRNPTGYAQVLEELSASGSLLRAYAYGLDLVSQREADGTVYYFLTDGQGSTRLLVSETGVVTNAFAYDAYGTLVASATPPQTAYLYTGEQWDKDLGMYCLRARYYHPGIGRFWTMDSFEGNRRDPLSLHKYLYTANNPVNSTDPSGNNTLAEATAVVGILGTLTTLTGLAITHETGQMANLDADGIPDAVVLTINESFQTRGFGADYGFDVIYHFKTKKLYAYFAVDVGLSPLSALAKHKNVIGPAITGGVVWNMNSADEWSGEGLTATWPASVLHLLPGAVGRNNKMFAAISQLSKRQLNQKPSDWVVQFGFSTTGPAFLKAGPSSNAFAAQTGWASQPIDLMALGQSLVDLLGPSTANELNRLPSMESDPLSIFDNP